MTIARLSNAQRVVVKIGSALLTDGKTGKLNRDWLGAFVADVAAMRARGQEMLIVSSGAIALGRRALGLPSGRLKLEESQAAATSATKAPGSRAMTKRAPPDASFRLRSNRRAS